jgi:hypothetical protein
MTGNPSPFDFTEARAAARSASEAQAATENAIREAVRDRATAERNYRRALAARILRAHDEGIAWTVCSDIARGDENVSELRHARDVAEGICEALLQAGWRHSADRKDLTRLIAWSERVAPDGQREPGRLRGAA